MYLLNQGLSTSGEYATQDSQLTFATTVTHGNSSPSQALAVLCDAVNMQLWTYNYPLSQIMLGMLCPPPFPPPVYAEITGIPYTCHTFCMAPMGVDDMHAMHVVLKIVHIYVSM